MDAVGVLKQVCQSRGPLTACESVTTVVQRAGQKTPDTILTTYAHAISGEQKAMLERMDEDYLRTAIKTAAD